MLKIAKPFKNAVKSFETVKIKRSVFAKVGKGILLCFGFMEEPPISFHVHMIPRRRKKPGWSPKFSKLHVYANNPSMPNTIAARIVPEIDIIFVSLWKKMCHLTIAVVE